MTRNEYRRSVGIIVEDCDDVVLGGNRITGFDDGIIAKRTTRLKINKSIINNRLNIDMPDDMFRETFNAVEALRQNGGVAPTSTQVISAAQSSGLKRWLAEHGVDLARFAVEFVKLFQ